MAFMKQEQYDRIFGTHVPVRIAPKRKPLRSTGKANRDLACPMIIQDGMEPMNSMADGQVYDSKSSYYRSLKDQGCEIVEGTLPAAPLIDDSPIITTEDVKQAFEQSVSELGGGAI
jgi:hypothetical protein